MTRINLFPHERNGAMLCYLDENVLEFKNVENEIVQIKAGEGFDTQAFRNAWKIYTVEMMHYHTEMTIIRKGTPYIMEYSAGYKLFQRTPKNRSFMIWARPITTHHLAHCIDNGRPMSEAVKHVKMTSESFRKWNMGKRPNYYGNQPRLL